MYKLWHTVRVSSHNRPQTFHQRVDFGSWHIAAANTERSYLAKCGITTQDTIVEVLETSRLPVSKMCAKCLVSN